MKIKHFGLFSLVSLFGLVLIGCGPKPTTGAQPPKGQGQGSESTKLGPNGEQKPTLSSIDAALKTDAYQYNGFDRDKPLTYLFTRVQGDKPATGTQGSELKAATKEAATFLVRRTGSLEFMGEDEVEARADGVYLISTSQGKPEKPVRQMPAKLDVGTVWTYEYKLKSPAGDDMTMKGTGKVEGTEKVKVTAGEFETIRVVESATLIVKGTSSKVSMKTWYSKGLGIVQMKMELHKSGDDALTITSMELSSTGE